MNDLPTQAPKDYLFSPVAYLHSSSRYRYEAARQPEFSETPARIEFLPGHNYERALDDLEGIERLWVIFVFHLNETWNPKVAPPLVPSDGKKKFGLFATRSPHRPNPVGLSCVRLLKRENLTLFIENSDMLDATPVLDVKPYIPYVDAFPDADAGWRSRLEEEAWAVLPAPDAFLFEEKSRFLKELSNLDLLNFAKVQLRFHPFDAERKRLGRLAENEYFIACRTWRIHYSADHPGRRILLREIRSNYSAEELLPGAEDRYADKEIHRLFLKRYPESAK